MNSQLQVLGLNPLEQPLSWLKRGVLEVVVLLVAVVHQVLIEWAVQVAVAVLIHNVFLKPLILRLQLQ
jgi:hypothetical protein